MRYLRTINSLLRIIDRRLVATSQTMLSAGAPSSWLLVGYASSVRTRKIERIRVAQRHAIWYAQNGIGMHVGIVTGDGCSPIRQLYYNLQNSWSVITWLALDWKHSLRCHFAFAWNWNSELNVFHHCGSAWRTSPSPMHRCNGFDAQNVIKMRSQYVSLFVQWNAFGSNEMRSAYT